MKEKGNESDKSRGKRCLANNNFTLNAILILFYYVSHLHEAADFEQVNWPFQVCHCAKLSIVYNIRYPYIYSPENKLVNVLLTNLDFVNSPKQTSAWLNCG